MSNSGNARIALYAALIFLAGTITGALVAPKLGRPFLLPPQPHEMSEHMLARLRSGLDLTDEQAAKIKPIVEKVGTEMGTIHRQTVGRVMERIAQANQEISLLLTPEQKTKFIKMEAEHQRRMGHPHHFAEPPGS